MIHDATAPSSRSLRLLVTIIGIGMAVGSFITLPACGDDDPAAPPNDGPFTGTIQVRDNSFSPRTATISVGDSVTWQWVGSSLHTVTQGTTPDASEDPTRLFDSPLKSSGTFGYRFTAPGTVPYFCRPHFAAGMTGTITVEP